MARDLEMIRPGMGVTLAFVIGLGVFELVFLRLPYERLGWLVISENWGAALLHALLAVWGLAAAGLSLRLARSAAGLLRAAAAAAGTLALFYEYTYQGLYGRFSLPVDIVIGLVASNAEQKQTAIAQAAPWALLPALIWATLCARPLPPLTARRGAFAALTVAAWPLACWITGWEIPVLSIANTARSLASAGLERVTTERPNRSPVQARPTRRGFRNVLLIVDEAVNADHLSINGYRRDTTPFLSSTIARLPVSNWGTAVSGATCSAASIELLLSGLPQERLPDTSGTRYAWPSLFAYARAAGYRTVLMDGQMTSHWIEVLEDRADIDSLVLANEFGAPRGERHLIDHAMARRIHNEWARGRSFIVALKSGLHYPYDRRFPAGLSPWSPYWTGRRVDLSRLPELVNAYDNGVLWSVDRFFEALLGQPHLLPPETVVLYTSDHGQALGRTGRAASHCGLSPFEVQVPLMLFGYPRSLKTSAPVSHENIFPTLIDLMGYEPEAKYATSLLRDANAGRARRYAGPDLAKETIAFPEQALTVRALSREP